jgi:hypothetical protein
MMTEKNQKKQRPEKNQKASKNQRRLMRWASKKCSLLQRWW